jgi:hypothetical protein
VGRKPRAGPLRVLTLAPARPGGGGPQDAYAAVRQAASLTATAAEQSGVATTSLTQNGSPVLTSTFSWNGSDLSLVTDSNGSDEIRYVDGIVYERATADGQWQKLGSVDLQPVQGSHGLEDGPQSALGNAWGAIGRAGQVRQQIFRDLGGLSGKAAQMVGSVLKGLTQVENADGSRTYSGPGWAAELLHEFGFPSSVRLAGADTDTPMTVQLTVGTDGIIRELKGTFGANNEWTYVAEYTQLGSAPTVTAPQGAVDATTGK